MATLTRELDSEISPTRRSWWTLLRLWLRPAHQVRTLDARVTLEQQQPIAEVANEYLSYSIDISVLAGGFWWEGSQGTRKGLGTLRIPPLDLNSDKLDKLTQALGPAYLRIGGSEADKIHYFQAPPQEPDSLVLTQAIWDRLLAFRQRNRLRLAFTVKYGLFQRREQGQWSGSEVEKLLRYTMQQGHTLDVCELGNELNAYWAFHGLRSQPTAASLALDYHRFSALVKRFMPEARVIGPGSAFWPRLGETIKPFSNITKKFLETCEQQGTALDIVDWHYYPFQSLRAPVRTRTATATAMLRPRALNDFQRYSQQLRQWRDKHAPNAELWTGETGSAQCGGQPKLSDRFISCFWWADQLGLGARCGQQVMIRQSLIGGEYGMIDRLTLKPRPDYWLSWLWKQLMGTQVYAVGSPHHMLRCYCHNTPEGGGKTLLLINLSARPMRVEVQQLGNCVRQYALTAKQLQSKKVRINGRKARYQAGQFCLEDFRDDTIRSEIPGHSLHFWLYE